MSLDPFTETYLESIRAAAAGTKSEGGAVRLYAFSSQRGSATPRWWFS
jgi:hypothetical protein